MVYTLKHVGSSFRAGQFFSQKLLSNQSGFYMPGFAQKKSTMGEFLSVIQAIIIAVLTGGGVAAFFTYRGKRLEVGAASEDAAYTRLLRTVEAQGQELDVIRTDRAEDHKIIHSLQQEIAKYHQENIAFRHRIEELEEIARAFSVIEHVLGKTKVQEILMSNDGKTYYQQLIQSKQK